MTASTVPISFVSRLFGALLVFCCAPAALAAPLTVTPAMGGQGTVISVRASGLSSSTTYALEFVGSPATSLGTVTTDPRGTISTTKTLPALPPGSGKMRVKTTGLGSVVVAYTTFTALSSMTFTPQATTIHAGQSIRYSVTNLSPGTLTILYEGLALGGPIAVSHTTYNGKFVVPTDRPSPLPATAHITVINKVGRVTVAQLQKTISVLPRLLSPFQIGITQQPPTQVRHGQRFNVTGQFALNENEAEPEQVSMWYFGDNGQVFPLGAAQATASGNQLQYSLYGSSAGGLSMTAGPGGNGRVAMTAPSRTAVGMLTTVTATPTNTTFDQLPDDRWQVRVRVTRQNGQPIAGALVQFDGVAGQDDSSDGSDSATIGDYVISANLPNQYSLLLRATDSRGCPLTYGRKLTDAQGYAEFEFLDEDLALAQVPRVYAEAGGQIETYPPRPLLMAIDASATGYGFQFASGPNAGEFLPHIYEVQFIGAGDGIPQGDEIIFTDYYQHVEVRRGTRNTTFPLGLPPIQPKVVLYDTSIVPWIAHKGPLVVDSGGEGFATNRLIFGPIFSQRGINAAWITTRPGEGFPTTLAVRTDPAVTGAVSSAKLYLDVNRTGGPEYVVNFTPNVTAVDCSIGGLNSSITWRAPLPDVRQQASGAIKGYLEFIGTPASGQARRYVQIDMQEQDLSWLSASRYSDREVEFSAGGQRIGVLALEDTADAMVQLDQDPGYEIGRLKNSTDNTRMIEMYHNNDGSELNYAPLDGAHKEAGRNGAPTMVEAALGVQYGPTTLTLIDQSFPLFYYVWGVPVLAGIEVGANFSLLAEIETRSKFTLKPNREPQFEMKTTPSLDLGLNFYVDIDVLFDLVDGGVDLDAIFSLDMPITVNAAHPEGVVNECFTAALLFSWHFEVFCLPLDFICDAINDIEGAEVLLSDQTGSGCGNVPPSLLAVNGGSTRPSSRIFPMHTAVAFSQTGAAFIAFTRNNSGGTAPPVLVVRPADGGDFDRVPDETVLSTAPGIRSVDIAFYTGNRAVIVWAESDRNYATLAALRPAQRLARQRLMYSLFDGENWSTKQALTSANGGEGGVDLAACTEDPGTVCDDAGEVLAVWTRDMAGDITQHRTRIYSSRYDPARGWTTPQPVDGAAVLDSAPSAAYVGGKPVVAFVRSTNGVFGDTDTRRIAYRFLDSTSNTVQVPAGLPGGAAWPSIVGLEGGKFAIAHTYANDPRAFVGNTQRIALANANACASGLCTVTAQSITDANGRPIYGERPTAMVDERGDVSVVMRGMGYGPGTNGSNVNHHDSIGMAMHTGDLISFAVDPAEHIVVPGSLSIDGAGHFAPSAAYDPEMGQVVAMSTRGPVIPQQLRDKFLASGATPAPARATTIEADPGLLMFSAEQGADLSIESVSSTSTTLTGGASFTARVAVRNAGTHYAAGLNGYQVRMSWDAPYDAGGTSVGTRLIPNLDAGEDATLSITVSVPAGFMPDQPHRLYATVFRNGSSVDDVQGSNDEGYASYGGMPMPFALNAAAIKGTTLVQLSWDPIADPQHMIAGYRVWCHDGDGEWRHLGSSFELGFLDVAAPVGVQRHYQVTSYSKNAIESPPSSEAVATAVLADGVFSNGFE